MIVINTISDIKFSFNGVNYLKNFTPIVVGSKIEILNTYDSKIKLTDFPTSFDQFEVDGNTFANVALLQDALLLVIFTRSSLGGGGGGIPEAPLDGQLYGRQYGAWSLVPTVGASLNTESVTIDNFWNHGSSFNFLRSNSNLAGFNRETLDQTTGSTTIVLADILASSSLYATSRSKYISKVLIDCHGVSGTVNEWIISLRAYQKINTSPFIVNVIDLGEVTFTKGDLPQAFASLTPSVIEIPEDYLVTCFLRKTTGTGFDIKAAITFKFDDYV